MTFHVPAGGGAPAKTQPPVEPPADGGEGTPSDDSVDGGGGEGGQPPADGGDGDGDGRRVLGRGGQPMSEEAISARVQRALRKQLRDMFGTEDSEEAKKIAERGRKPVKELSPEEQKEFDKLRRDAAARRRGRMTQEQRLRSEIEERNATINKLQEENRGLREDNVSREQDARIDAIAAPFIDPADMRYVRRDLGDFLRDLRKNNPDKFKKFGDKQLANWFEAYAQEHPKFAKKAEEPPPPPAEPPPAGDPPKPRVVRTVTTTRMPARTPSPDKSPKAPGTERGKTIRPGPNQMSKDEVREAFRKHGVRYPG